MSSHFKAVIIGSGPAGLTAAIYLGRADLKPVVIDGSQPGGQLMLTTDVGNYPGFAEDINGQQLMDQMRKQAERFDTQFISEEVQSVDFSQKPFSLTTGKQTMTADTVIVATGASARWLGLESEERLKSKGVSACATCDGFFFKEKDVVVVGAGDSAMEEATFLTKFASSVTVLVRKSKDDVKASKIMMERAFNNPKITFMYNTVVEEILGENTVEGVRIKDTSSDKTQELKVQGVFVAIGHVPNTKFIGDQLELEKGYIKVTGNTNTSAEGVFAAGDVQDWRYRQAISAAGVGCMAALDAEKYLAEYHTSK